MPPVMFSVITKYHKGRHSLFLYNSEIFYAFTQDILRSQQKTALVCAFMTKAPLLLLDEPTTGLDPVMRDAFIDLVLKVKANGTTVFLSSHMFNELERTCDRILFLKDGKVIDVVDQNKFETIHSFQKVKIQTSTSEGFQKILTSFSETSHVNSENHEITVLISNTKVATLLVLLQDIEIDDISFDTQTLDNYFEKELQVK